MNQDIQAAAEVIRRGGLVAFPTETVYGLGANALDPAAVAAIFELKGRPRLDPLIVHVADQGQLSQLVKSVPPLAMKLIERFWPGPLSLVLEKQSCIPDIVTSGLPNVAVRCPSNPIAQQLIRAAGVPIAAPSANRFGRISPTTKAHVLDQFGDQIPIVLDGGPCQVGVESTVVSFLGTTPVLLRPGGVTLEAMEEVIGVIQAPLAQADRVEEQRPISPGQLASHYAPTAPLVLDANAQPDQGKRIGLLSFQQPDSTNGFAAVEVLSEKGCLREAAVNLFAAMRRLDEQQLDGIIARPLPEVDLGRAIMDRLQRASA